MDAYKKAIGAKETDYRFRVIPNAHNDYLFKDFSKHNQKNIIWWRGSV
jgi:hypothetical protein